MGVQKRWGLPARVAIVGLILASIPAALVVDVYITPWQVPTRIIYAIPIMIAGRLLSVRATTGVIVMAVAFSVLDAWLVGIAWQTEILSAIALIAIGSLSVLWANAERRSEALAQERARLHQEQLQRAAELEDSHSRLLDFFSMVAHDLRSPLTIISGYEHMLARWDTLSPERRETAVAAVKSAIGRVVRLSADLADASRVGTGHFAVDTRPCDLVCLVQDALERRPAGRKHHVVFKARTERAGVRCDAERLAQVIDNLVDNAIKYSPDGGEVRVEVEQAGQHARLSVSDQGIGIGREDIPRLFQPYKRLKRSSETKEGLGLGLYIVWGIVQAHHGTVSVQSEVGKGSTFVVDLPLDDSA